MSIKVLSTIDETYLSKLNTAKSSSSSISDVDASFSDALASAQKMLDAENVSDAEKNAVRAMAVDAAVDAIKQNGGYGLSLDSSLAQSLGLSAPLGTFGGMKATHPLQVETKEDVARRNASEVTKPSTSSTSSAGTTGSVSSSELDKMLTCSDELEEIFEEASSTYEVDMKLLKIIGLIESDYNPNCTSSAGAMGVMQLMPDTAKELGVEHPYDPYENIMGGTKYLAKLLDKYDGDIALAAAAYNAGPGAVSKYNGIPPYDQTQRYVKKVVSYYNS